MRKIIFVRTAPYSYQQPNKSLYRGLDATGLQIGQPHILKSSTNIQKKVNLILTKYKPTLIFCSEFTRSQETAKLFSQSVIIAKQLNEIKFSMNDFTNHKELGSSFDTKKINKIRYKFSRALLNDSLQEKQKNILKRITKFNSILEQTPSNASILCCSHGFIMKLYENFLRDNTKNFRDIITSYDWTKPPFNFLDEFTVTLNNKKML